MQSIYFENQTADSKIESWNYEQESDELPHMSNLCTIYHGDIFD